MTVGSDPGGVLADTLAKDSPSEDSHISIPILVTYNRTVPSSNITASGLTPSGPIVSTSAARVQSSTKELVGLESISEPDASTFESMTIVGAFAGSSFGSGSTLVGFNCLATGVIVVALSGGVSSRLLSFVGTC